VIAQPLFDCVSWLIAASQPDHFWRRAIERRHVSEIDILGNEDETVGFRILPDGLIVSLFHTDQAYLI